MTDDRQLTGRFSCAIDPPNGDSGSVIHEIKSTKLSDRLLRAVLSAGLPLLLALGCDRQVADQRAGAPATVIVEIVQDGETRAIEVPDVQQGTTVDFVMRKLDGIQVSISGSGSLAFLDQIGDRATGNGQGWTFAVDGTRSERGIGATQLSPPTTVTWTYGNY